MGLMIVTVSDTVPCPRGPFGVHGFPGHRQTSVDGARARQPCWPSLALTEGQLRLLRHCCEGFSQFFLRILLQR